MDLVTFLLTNYGCGRCPANWSVIITVYEPSMAMGVTVHCRQFKVIFRKTEWTTVRFVTSTLARNGPSFAS